jgi:hypothetical protein
VPADAPQGLCPVCLLGDALMSTPSQAGISEAAEAVTMAHAPVEGERPMLAATADMQPTAPASESAIPATLRYFGDYELVAELARGGMGVVYKARQVTLNRTVAVKMILAGQLASAQEVARFQLEAEAVANLDHPNILPIYEVGQHEGQQYFSMKLVDGGSLAQQAPASTEARVDIMVKVARAVHHAHQSQVLHRDLKPGNVLLDRDGTPFVTDFGLAKRTGDSGLTQSGAIVGTPSYMAPEQARADKTLTTACDVYSLGAILYELLTGKPPFRGATPLDTVLQVLEQDPVAPSQLRPNVDRDLATIALMCLRKEPVRRYESAAALAADLERWQRREPVLARPVGPAERVRRWARRNPALAALSGALALSLIVGLVGLTLLYTRAENLRREAEHERDQARRSLARNYLAGVADKVDRGDVLGALPAVVEALALEESNPARAEIHRIRLALHERLAPRLERQWHGPGPARWATFSPDGRRVIAAGEEGDDGKAGWVQAWDVASGRAVGDRVALPFWPSNPSLSADGRRLAASDTARMLVVDLDNGKRLSPWGDNQMPPALGGRVEVADHGIPGIAGVFTPDGGQLLAVDANEEHMGFDRWDAVLWDLAGKKPVTEPLPLGGTSGSHDRHDAVSPDGKLLLTAGAEGFLLWNRPMT